MSRWDGYETNSRTTDEKPSNNSANRVGSVYQPDHVCVGFLQGRQLEPTSLPTGTCGKGLHHTGFKSK